MILAPLLPSRTCMKDHGSSQLPLFFVPGWFCTFFVDSLPSFFVLVLTFKFLKWFICLFLCFSCIHFYHFCVSCSNLLFSLCITRKRIVFRKNSSLQTKCYSRLVPVVCLTLVGRTITLPLQEVLYQALNLHITYILTLFYLGIL